MYEKTYQKKPESGASCPPPGGPFCENPGGSVRDPLISRGGPFSGRSAEAPLVAAKVQAKKEEAAPAAPAAEAPEQ